MHEQENMFYFTFSRRLALVCTRNLRTSAQNSALLPAVRCTPPTVHFSYRRLSQQVSSVTPHEDIINHESSYSTAAQKVLFADEIIKVLSPEDRKGTFLDFTFGSGGHTRKILESESSVKVIAIDRDPETSEAAKRLKLMFPGRFSYFNIKFR